MKIGYIGYGFVGRAQHTVFEYNSEAYIVDPKLKPQNTISEMVWGFNPQLIFVSVPAPTLVDGSVDHSIIVQILQELSDNTYNGLVVLKSTVTPDIIEDLYIKFAKSEFFNKDGPLRFIYSPEFLREKDWLLDALQPRQILMAGDYNDCLELKDYYDKHSHIKGEIDYNVVDYKMAALAKYAINSFLAMKVTFMNQMFKLLEDLHEGELRRDDWVELMQIMMSDGRIGNTHLEVPGPDMKFGYGGSCLPKDVKAIIAYDKNGRLSLIRETEIANTKIRIQE